MTSTPHDALFKAAFGQPSAAAALIRHILPSSMVNALIWETLIRAPDSLTDPLLINRHTDLLFSIRVRDPHAGPDRVYLQVEHQSANLMDFPYRALRYVVDTSDELESRHSSKQRPWIVSIVVSHAKGGWTGPRDLAGVFGPPIPGLVGVPTLRPLLLDLAHATNDQLHQMAHTPFCAVTLWMLRDARDPSALFAQLPEWRETLVAMLAADDGDKSLDLILRYLDAVMNKPNYENLKISLTELIPDADDGMVHYGTELQREARQEGKQEGLQEALELLLRRKFDDIPAAYVARLASASSDQVQRYLDRILTATSIAEVFDEPAAPTS